MYEKGSDELMVNTVIVDTSSFISEQCDFLGMESKLIPSFFQLLGERGIELLSHPILISEGKQHIPDCIPEKFARLKKSLLRYKDCLPFIGISADKAIQAIDDICITQKTVAAFEEFFAKAIMLPYPAPETIFSNYFSHMAPFQERGKKKSEFPDAFVIEAIKAYQ